MNRKMLVLAVLLFAAIAKGQAQEFKIGYTFLDGIVFAMPEIPGINSQLETTKGMFDKQINTKGGVLQALYAELQAMSQDPATNQQAFQDKQKEFTDKEDELQKYRAQADQSYAAKQAELMNPIYQKVQEAIEEVRKEKGFAIVLNAQIAASASLVLAADEAYDITKDVFAKLGVEMPEPPAASADGND